MGSILLVSSSGWPYCCQGMDSSLTYSSHFRSFCNSYFWRLSRSSRVWIKTSSTKWQRRILTPLWSSLYSRQQHDPALTFLIKTAQAHWFQATSSSSDTTRQIIITLQVPTPMTWLVTHPVSLIFLTLSKMFLDLAKTWALSRTLTTARNLSAFQTAYSPAPTSSPSTSNTTRVKNRTHLDPFSKSSPLTRRISLRSP